MPLSVGQRLGAYEILAPLGAGGMGEVYRAIDTRLDREVAIKILPDNLAQDGDRLARFEREAKLLASLNHPNIAQIYGIEDRALVMELVEGETLKGPLPEDTALKIARQIAEALEAAHEKGIVHRDLKPANVMVTPEGTVKVLDFGLAKGAENVVAAGNPSISPTLTVRATELGVIMGTAAYMSPEQAAGKSVDKRSDIWSFGVVLFELLAGRRLFDGETISHTLADVLRAPIDFDRLPRGTPTTIRALLRRCLDRNVKTRLRDIGEARIAIEAALSDAAGEGSVPEVAPARSSLNWKIVALAVAAPALISSVLGWNRFREKPPQAEAARFEIPPPANGQFTCCVAISPDGRKIAFTAQEGADLRPRLWIRTLDALEPKTVYNNLVGGNTAPHPFWSPDSRFVAFAAGGKIRKVEASGGPSETICDAPLGFTGGAWIDDSTIVIDGIAGLARMPANGGLPSPITRVDPSRQESAHSGPEFLPDRKHFLYLRRSAIEQNNGVFVGSLDTKPGQQDMHRLLATNYPAAYAPSPDTRVGNILFLRENTLVAQPFDQTRLALTGDAVPVAESIAISNQRGVFGVSPAGTLIYRTGTPSASSRRLTWFDRQGTVLSQLGEPADYNADIVISPGGNRVAIGRGPQGGADIWVLDSRGVSTRLTFDGAGYAFPVWSPDGSRLAYRSNRGGHFNLYEKPSNGAGDETLLLKSDEDKFPTDWSPDGRFLLFTSIGAKTNYDLWTLPLGSASGQPALLLRTEAIEGNGRFSPDGRWIAYTSTESGKTELYVRPFVPAGSASSHSESESAGKWQVSKDGTSAAGARWRSDGKELFFLGSGQAVMAVDVSTSPVFSSGNPKPMFRLPPGVGTRWDITADGKRLLAEVPVDSGQDTNSITVVLNWAAGLKK